MSDSDALSQGRARQATGRPPRGVSSGCVGGVPGARAALEDQEERE